MKKVLTGSALYLVLLTACADSNTNAVQSDEPKYAPPRESWAPDMEECLKAKGWSAKAKPDGGLETLDIPTEREQEFEVDFAACTAEYGYDLPAKPIDAERAAEIFDALLKAADCVAALGYRVDEPPIRQFAIEQLQKEAIDLGWHSHEHVPPLEQDMAYTKCPAPIL